MVDTQHDWFKQRSYCHLDRRISVQTAEALVSSPDRVASHSFKPLIWFNETTRLWKKRIRKPGDPEPGPQPVSGPRPARLAQAKILQMRESKGERTNLGEWKTKKRPIAYASHKDAAIYSYYNYKLSEEYERVVRERGIDESVLAYRFIERSASGRGKSNFDFAAEAFAQIHRRGPCRVHCLDIKGFFDNIPHALLKDEYRKVLGSDRIPDDHFHVLTSVTEHSKIPLRQLMAALGVSVRQYERMRRRLQPFELPPGGIQALVARGLVHSNKTADRKGIPQGLPLSGLYASVAMLTIDEQLTKLARACECTYKRYSDDILIWGPSSAADTIAAIAGKLLREAHFEVPEAKATQHTFSHDDQGRLSTDRPLVYLGLQFDGRAVLVRHQTLARLEKRAKRAVRTAGRVAAREWNGIGTIRIRRRHIYNLYSPLPYKWAASDRRRWRGDFTNYARHAQDAVDVAFGTGGLSQILRQLHPRMARLKAFIEQTEKDVTQRERSRRMKAARTSEAEGITRRPDGS